MMSHFAFQTAVKILRRPMFHEHFWQSRIFISLHLLYLQFRLLFPFPLVLLHCQSLISYFLYFFLISRFLVSLLLFHFTLSQSLSSFLINSLIRHHVVLKWLEKRGLSVIVWDRTNKSRAKTENKIGKKIRTKGKNLLKVSARKINPLSPDEDWAKLERILY